MTKKAMYTAYSNLDNVTDPRPIDCYIYQLNSEQNGTITFLQRQKNLSYPRLDSDSIRIVVLYRYYIFYSINCQYLFYFYLKIIRILIDILCRKLIYHLYKKYFL